MPSLRENVTKTTSVPMWVGSEGDFQRLLQLVETPFEPLIEDHVEEKLRHPREMAASAASRLAYARRELERGSDAARDYAKNMVENASTDVSQSRSNIEEAERVARNAGRLDLRLSINENEMRKTTGTAEELVSYLRGRTFREIEVSAPSGLIPGHTIVLRASAKTGVYVSVNSGNAQWATAAFADLESALIERVPKWKIIRQGWLLYIMFFVAGWVGGWNLSDAVVRWAVAQGMNGEILAVILFFSLCLGVAGGAVLATEFTRKRIPAFEVVPLGEKSKGKVIIGAIVGAAATVALGLITNGLSAAFLS